jgi:hypothetical protein
MIESLDAWLRAYGTELADVVSVDWLREESDSTVATLIHSLCELPPPTETAQLRAVDRVLETLLLRAQDLSPIAGEPIGELAGPIGELYRQWGETNPVRYRLLQWLATSRQPQHLQLLTELLVESPLHQADQVAQVFSPLVQPHRLEDLAHLFPRLLDGMGNLPCAAPILDLSNFATRKRALATHPAIAQSEKLAELLGKLSRQLQYWEEQPPGEEASPQQLSRQVADAVSLTVSICDALALIGNRDHVGKLLQTLELRHRRIQTEAAAALVRLGEPVGKEALLALVAEPVARLRVLAYAEELGFADEIPEEMQAPLARAEASLVLWLGEPTQLGIPPTSCELFDQRELFWPGYGEPVGCYLFRFSYELAGGKYSNIGIVGPLVHAFAADLQDLSPDDIYAAYAGWQAEHEEIHDQDADRLGEFDQRELDSLQRYLHEEGYEAVQPELLGSFFGRKVLVARAQRSGRSGVVVGDAEQVQWHPHGNRQRQLGPPEAWSIYKGRQLLATFND